MSAPVRSAARLTGTVRSVLASIVDTIERESRLLERQLSRQEREVGDCVRRLVAEVERVGRLDANVAKRRSAG